jgi:hypothetical protein
MLDGSHNKLEAVLCLGVGNIWNERHRWSLPFN